MMSREVVELDFFGMEKEKRHKSTIKDIQRAISKINPQLIHHVITSASIPGLSLPVLVPESRFDSETSLPGTAPLTMFYNGKVMVFDLSNDKATNIMRMAGEAAVPKCVSNTTSSMLGNFTGGN
ncbi:protein TIFY 9-like isoform X2 [Carex littledalei]|uniref:Protein TIFY 9-like isoform X2 n=1 Tax=Carex littledalei TaxID=544730 RepID=A0A833V4J8_9POAL|nr:protein TIFY 9-like isoform X2 [Carex littledalei]